MYGGLLISGVSSFYDLVKLVKCNLVVVIINYCLGVLGYFSYLAFVVEIEVGNFGNYGLMDQQVVLCWVWDNIVVFGGDLDNVIFSG